MNANIDKPSTGELVDLTKDYAELAVDSFLEDGLLKDIPVVGTILSAIKIGKNIKDALFIRKLCKFIFELQEIEQHEKDEFSKKLGRDNDKITNIGMSVMLLIEKVNDFKKAEYLGKLFNAFIKGQIEESVFFKLSNIIDHSFVEDLDILYEKYTGKLRYRDNREDILYTLGLLNLVGTDGRAFVTASNDHLPIRPEYAINEFGNKLLEIIIIPNKNAR